MWTCLTCTYAGNPPLFLACSICNTVRGDPEPAPQPSVVVLKKDEEEPPKAAPAARGSSSTTKSPPRSSKPAQVEQKLSPSAGKRRESEDELRRDDDVVGESSPQMMPEVAQKPSQASSERDKDASNDTKPAARAVSKPKSGPYARSARDTEPFPQAKRLKQPPEAPASVPHSTTNDRVPPPQAVPINNLSDRQYCCVWNVEVFEDGYRPEVARAMLAQVARHVNPILRARGWRVKRLIESASSSFLGCCYPNGRNDADAASTNIKLNLRRQASKHCKDFYSFGQVLSVMLHEITHTSIGLEDIHPPAFWDLLAEIRQQYQALKPEIALETDTYGCDETMVKNGQVMTIAQAASDIVQNDLAGEIPTEGVECGVSKKRNRRWKRRRTGRPRTRSNNGARKEKRRPLLKGTKMIDGRTKAGKAAKVEKENLSARELAARAALARLGGGDSSTADLDDKDDDGTEVIDIGSSDDESSDEDDLMVPHDAQCLCRGCHLERRFVAQFIQDMR